MFEIRPVETPYPGLRPFEPHESEIFFGRDGHRSRLLEILQRERFLAVVGPSGCGKSSLVRAGLLPGLASGALGTGSDWRIALLRPGGQPLLALAQALLGAYALGDELVGKDRLPKDAEDVTADVALIAAELRRGKEGLSCLVQTAAARRPETAEPFNLLVLVDQFEEIFTYAATAGGTDDEAETFVNLLLATRADAACRVYVALTMRTDFLGQCVDYSDLPEAINRAQYLTPRLNRKELEQAIVGPARVFGGDVETGLVDKLIASIHQDSDQLPILQHALARMWQVAEPLNPDSPVLDAKIAEAVGGVDGALDRHANDVLASLTGDRQALAEKLFRAITERRENGGQDVRHPQTLAAIADWAGVPAESLEPVIEAFAVPEVSFLHYGRELTDNSVIDLTHEALIRQWAKLGEWVADEYRRGLGYQRVSQRAAEYRDGINGRLTGGDLVRAMEWWNPRDEKPLSPEGRGVTGEGSNTGWQPTPPWAQRYSEAKAGALDEEFKLTRQFLIDSRDAEQLKREAEQKRLEQQAEAERQRADKEKQLADEARASLFESQLTHGSLLAQVEDYAGARQVLAESAHLDPDIPASRRHARNLLAGYVEMMGGQAGQLYKDAGAALVGGVKLSPDGKLLAAAGERGTLVLFNASSGILLHRLEGHDPKADDLVDVNSVVFDPQGRWLFSGGDDGRIIRWALPSGEKLGEWPAPDSVHALALSPPDGATLASGGKDGKIILWNVADGKKMLTLKGHTDSIAYPDGLAFSADGSRLASASFDTTARIWDWRKGKSLFTLENHSKDVEAVVFSPDGKLLATASDDKQVILWNAKTGNLLRSFPGHRNSVFNVAFSADGRQLLSASADKRLRLWDVASGITRRIYQGHEAGLTSVALQGDRLYTASNDATVRRWTLTTPDQWIWETGGEPQSAAISPNGKSVAVGMEDGTLRLYGLPDGKPLGEPKDAHSGEINRITFNGDGSLLATAGSDGKAKLWQLDAEGKQLTALHTLEGHTKAVYAVAFSPDGRRLATASYDGQIGLFDVASGKGRLFLAHKGLAASIAFNPQGDHLLSAGKDRRLLLWDLNDLSLPPLEIAQAQDYLLWASFSPDGREVAAVGRGAVVSLYDLAKPGTPRRLVGHEQTVLLAIYSPDGRQLATVGADMTVRLWDLDSLHLLFTLHLPTEDQLPSPLWDFDFRCIGGECWIAVPLTVGRLALYRLPYDHLPAILLK